MPRGRDVRPTTDRVREALFSHLGERVRGAKVLDLFAGSGALGLEALSRGARFAVFVDKAALAHVALNRNIDALDMRSLTQVLRCDALAALRRLEKKEEIFDLIFLDPPYQSSLLELSLDALSASKIISAKTTIIAESMRNREFVLPKGLRTTSTRRYGDTEISVIEKQT